MFAWINASLNRKIGSVLAVSLGFLLIVISYSIYQLRVINGELREVSQVDVPLSDIMTQVEMLQLKQHLSIERFRISLQLEDQEADSIDNFTDRHQQLTHLVRRASQLIKANLNNHLIKFQPEEYQLILDEIYHFDDINNQFKQRLDKILVADNPPQAEWQELELLAENLDANVISILNRINQLMAAATRYTEQHQESFMMIETALGVCAFILSTLLAFYVIQVIRQRIHSIHQQVEELHTSLEQGSPIVRPSDHNQAPQDELGELELDLKKMIVRLSDEMSTRKEVEQQLLELATKDKLTNAFNRHKWSEQIHLLMTLSSNDKVFSLISLDVDHFKQVNDTYGHQTGDQVLIALSQLLQANLQKSEMLFRMGGEEFTLLLPNKTLAEATQAAEQLRATIAQFRQPELPAFTVSMGVAEYRLGETEDQLMSRTDDALYQSKENGRNRLTVAN
ncbi:GGDEF domain-containing protein [Marinomonas pollencensis]|uniref:diguanylate cyclase n=1 Tax=Marinomonas pollencensis TaxID=491954 RepID=A0A3E0DI23_9GAMM|nr:GGDEF domain-containing protein [Marinomonas pollencensis]REG81424.1 diguanylate cyclase (GGDEF)-like protein [Marinomonas pollencensis]